MLFILLIFINLAHTNTSEWARLQVGTRCSNLQVGLRYHQKHLPVRIYKNNLSSHLGTHASDLNLLDPQR